LHVRESCECDSPQLVWVAWGAELSYASPRADTNGDSTAAEQTRSTSEQQVRTEQHARLVVSVRRLRGLQVHDADGARIGTIREVLFAADGRASAVVVSAGSFLGMGSTHHQLAWDALDFLSAPGRIKTSTDAAELRALPSGAWRAARYKQQVRASKILLAKVVLEDDAHYGTIRDVVFGLDGQFNGLVIVPWPKLGDRRGDREPHVYRQRFTLRSDGRIALPYTRRLVRSSGSETAIRCDGR
jgi:sporulation protein YlmC with PRC-barrel domain